MSFPLLFRVFLERIFLLDGLSNIDGTGDTNHVLGNIKSEPGDNVRGVENMRMSQKTMVERIKA